MAAIAIGLLALCCCSSSTSAGSYMGGLVSGTEPHFLKTIEAPLMKELVEEVEKLTQERDDIEKTMDPTGPGDEEEKKKLLDFFEKVRNSDTCRTMREKDFKSKITDYKSSMILRLPTFESIQKIDLLKSYLHGDDADATNKKKEFDEFGHMCTMSDDEWDSLTSRLK
jgi:hypothetical protein